MKEENSGMGFRTLSKSRQAYVPRLIDIVDRIRHIYCNIKTKILPRVCIRLSSPQASKANRYNPGRRISSQRLCNAQHAICQKKPSCPPARFQAIKRDMSEPPLVSLCAVINAVPRRARESLGNILGRIRRLLVLEEEGWQQADARRKQHAQGDAQTPNRLCLKAPRPRGLRGQVVEAKGHAASDFAGSKRLSDALDALLDRKGVLERIAVDVLDAVAVEVGDGFAKGDGDDDEGNEQQGVDGSHDEEANVGGGPVEGDGDDSVEGCDASLDLLVTVARARGFRYVPRSECRRPPWAALACS